MANLLLFEQNDERVQELAALFEHAGYQVIEVNDLAACCRHLQIVAGQAPAKKIIPAPSCFNTAVDPIDIAICHASIPDGTDPVRRQPHLLRCILNLARQLTPGWRLSMARRRLEAPDGSAVNLTCLEYNFIKIFAMAEIGEAVSRKQIVRAFGEDYLSYDQNRIDTMVRRLRKKIKAGIGIDLPLNTERIRGFSFGDELILDL